MDELMLKVLEEPNRIINGEQYNDLYKLFTQTMTDEAARSFLAANYMMTHDFYSQYVNNGYLEDDLRLTSGLNEGIRKVEDQSRLDTLVNNLTPEFEGNMQSQYVLANTSNEQNMQGYSTVKADSQDLSQDLNYSVADGNEELLSREQERRQAATQDNQSDTKWSDFLSIQEIVSKLSSEHFDEDGSRKNNQGIEIEGNVEKASDGDLVITARYPDINIRQKFSGFSIPSDILDKPAAIKTIEDFKSSVDKVSSAIPLIAGLTAFNLLDSPTKGILEKLKIRNTASQGVNKTKLESNPFQEAGQLKPNIKYKSGEHNYSYETDGMGRISKFETDNLKLTNRESRLSHNPNTPGKLEGDHAGHLAGDRFGGSPELDNLVSQSSNVNLSQYRKLENQWGQAIKEGKQVKVNVEVKYEENGLRPSEFNVQYEIDGKYFESSILN